MRKTLNALDERLRRALTQSVPLAACIAAALATLVVFAALLATRTLGELSGADGLTRMATVAMLCTPLALMLLFAVRTVHAARESGLTLLAACAVCALAMLMRLSFIDHVSSDYEIYLSDWLAKFGALSFSGSMRAGVGEYNVLYQYILFLVSRLSVPSLYAVKAISLLGDALLAGALARLCAEKPADEAAACDSVCPSAPGAQKDASGARPNASGLTALCAALLLPSIALNAGMFAQCDSLYAACALWGLALALDGKGGRSAAMFALSLAFKLQAAFLLPIVAVLYAQRRLRLGDALVFIGTLLLTALPAMLGGKPLSAIIGIYTAQTGLYTGLTYNAPTLFGLMNTAGLDVYAYGNFGMALALGACAALVAYGVRDAGHAAAPDTASAGAGVPAVACKAPVDVVRLALVMTLLVVFLLPRMHERYFYLPVALSLAASVRDRRLVPCAALLELAMLATLWDMGLPLFACSAMVLAAIAWALLCGLRRKNA